MDLNNREHGSISRQIYSYNINDIDIYVVETRSHVCSTVDMINCIIKETIIFSNIFILHSKMYYIYIKIIIYRFHKRVCI